MTFNRSMMLTALLLLGCSTSEVDSDAKVPEAEVETSKVAATDKALKDSHLGKPQAPVDVFAEQQAVGAQVRVDFPTGATDVQITVKGSDGLQLIGEQIVAKVGDVNGGASESLSVPFFGTGSVAVIVEGRFNGVAMAKVKSFRMASEGQPIPLQSPGKVRAAGGRKGLLMPADGSR